MTKRSTKKPIKKASKPKEVFIALYSSCSKPEQCEYLTHGSSEVAVKKEIDLMIECDELVLSSGKIFICKVQSESKTATIIWA